MYLKNKNLHNETRVYTYIAFAIFLILLCIFIYWRERNKNVSIIKPISIGQNSKGTSELSNNASVDSPGSDSNSTNKQPVTTGSSDSLVTPGGTFVSNHRPNLDSSPAPNLIQSVCVTSPGASCYISFTKDSVVKSLTPQKTDAEGATYWSWKLQDIGLTVGSWKIVVFATLNGQTKSSTDAMAMEIGP